MSGGESASETGGENRAAGGIVDYYEGYWRDGYWTDNPYEQWKLARLRERVAGVERGARVLDVGCGDGRLLGEMARLGFEPFGVDISAVAIDALRARGLRGERADIDGGRLPVGDGSFDVVLCLDVLEHLFAPDRLLAEIRRVVAPGGLFVVAVPNGLNLFNRVAFAAGKHVDLMDKAHTTDSPFSEHIRFFSHRVFEAFLRHGGFEPTARDYFFPERASDARYRVATSALRLVRSARPHERAPSLFALEFLYACRPLV